MLVITIRFDERGEGDGRFASQRLTEITYHSIERVLNGPPLLSIEMRSAPDDHQVTIEPRKK